MAAATSPMNCGRMTTPMMAATAVMTTTAVMAPATVPTAMTPLGVGEADGDGKRCKDQSRNPQ